MTHNSIRYITLCVVASIQASLAIAQDVVPVWGAICKPERYATEWPLDNKLRTRSIPPQYLEAASFALLETEENGSTNYYVYTPGSNEPAELRSWDHDSVRAALNIILQDGTLITVYKQDWANISGRKRTIFAKSFHSINTYGASPKVQLTSVKGYCEPWVF